MLSKAQRKTSYEMKDRIARPSGDKGEWHLLCGCRILDHRHETSGSLVQGELVLCYCPRHEAPDGE